MHTQKNSLFWNAVIKCQFKMYMYPKSARMSNFFTLCSVWPSARHWPARAGRSTSLSKLAAALYSPWTPRTMRKCRLPKPRRRWALQLKEETREGENSFWLPKKLCPLWKHLWIVKSMMVKQFWNPRLQTVMKLRSLLCLVTFVAIGLKLRMEWNFTRRINMKFFKLMVTTP